MFIGWLPSQFYRLSDWVCLSSCTLQWQRNEHVGMSSSIQLNKRIEERKAPETTEYILDIDNENNHQHINTSKTLGVDRLYCVLHYQDARWSHTYVSSLLNCHSKLPFKLSSTTSNVFWLSFYGTIFDMIIKRQARIEQEERQRAEN